MWKKFAKDYLTFTKKDRAGIYALLLLIAITLFLPALFPFFKKEKKTDPEFEQQIAMLKAAASKDSAVFKKPDYYSEKNNPESVSLFYFDPNITTLDEWKRLGLREKTGQTILNYISKGGKFKMPSDLRKIYGLSQKDADRLIPFVRINEINKPGIGSFSSERKYTNSPDEKYTKPVTFSTKKIDINTADTSDFIAFRGIGSKLASRIVQFRQKLGGFISVDQVGETYFLPDSTFQKIKPYLLLGNGQPNKISINTADVNILRAHPYINYKIANVIVQYRNQHGLFGDVGELKKIHAINDSIFQKINPYLSVD